MALIRTEKTDDIVHIHAIHQEAFGRTTEGDLVDSLRPTNYFSPEFSLVAVVGDELVGHILLTRIVLKDEHKAKPVLALSPIAVKPAFQNQGIGRALITEGLRRAKYAGHRAVFVVGDPNFYGRFGFERASHHGITPPADMPDEAFLVASLGGSPLTMRGQAYYPLAFHEVS